jgi:hypothetical protein
MLKRVSQFETSDGTRVSDLVSAVRYEMTRLEESIGPLLDNTMFDPGQRLALMGRLVPDFMVPKGTQPNAHRMNVVKHLRMMEELYRNYRHALEAWDDPRFIEEE